MSALSASPLKCNQCNAILGNDGFKSCVRHRAKGVVRRRRNMEVRMLRDALIRLSVEEVMRGKYVY